jgi:phosphoglycerate dehydrogenase-like enzyme
LWQAPGLIISPHVGGNSSAFEPGMRALLATQLSRLASGEELLNIVMQGKGEDS